MIAAIVVSPKAISLDHLRSWRALMPKLRGSIHRKRCSGGSGTYASTTLSAITWLLRF